MKQSEDQFSQVGNNTEWAEEREQILWVQFLYKIETNF